MAWFDDIDVLHNATTPGDWDGTTGGGSSGYDSPTLNDNTATTPIFIEGSACMWWPLKKGITDGYTYTDTITGTPTITNRVCVGLLNYPFADLDAIPVTSLKMRLSSATTFTTNYVEWDAKAQILSPENVPISGHTPIIGYEDAGTESGTFNGDAQSIGYLATSGNDADGKQGGFDWFFIIGYVGGHSATWTDSFFSGLYSEYFDNEGNGIPGETSRPIAVLSQAGNFFQSNIKFQMGHVSSATANTVVDETGKTIFFNNLHTNHELGYVFVNPNSAHQLSVSLTDCVHFWNDQSSGSEIFDGATNCDTFKIDGCAFSNGGNITLPSSSANRYVRATKFSACRDGTASDGEFTDCTLDTCRGMTISSDANFTGTKILTPDVSSGTSGLVWNGNYDPDGNLDGMTFSKGTNAHHAIEFGTGVPYTMTLRNIAFSGFSATNSLHESTFHVKTTSGTMTINTVGCTGNMSYKSDGATVVIQSSVDITITVKDGEGNNIQNAQCAIYKTSDDTELMNEDSNVSGIATESVNYTGDTAIYWRVRKSSTGATKYVNASGTGTITSTGFSTTVTLLTDGIASS